MAKSPHLSRSEFVKVVIAALGTIMGAVIGLPAISYMLSPAFKKQVTDVWVSAGPLENYPVGVPTLFSFTRTKINGWEKTVNSFGVYIYRPTEEEILALSNVCTHLSCRVTWREDVEYYFCPCHDGRFDINGQVISGPPPKPLYSYETKVEEDILYMRVVEK
jgi:Rieske Fe-S protein